MGLRMTVSASNHLFDVSLADVFVEQVLGLTLSSQPAGHRVSPFPQSRAQGGKLAC